MRPTQHAAASAVLSIAFAYVTHSVAGTVACFLSGIFIDIDHFFDYWIAKRQLTFRYRDLDSFFTKEKVGKLYLVFHSYELWVVIWLLLVFLPFDIFWVGLAFGATVHLALDKIFNPLRPYVYFFMYRLKVGFAREAIYPADFFKDVK